jgi:phosphatidylglycerophosphate synthase
MIRRAFRHIPTGLSVLRLLAVPWVVSLARRGARGRCCAAIATLVGIDLADGILARRIGDPVALRRQRRMDSAADLAFGLAVPLCIHWVRPELLRQERVPITLVVATQATSLVACYTRFGRLPRYHTEAYKWSSGTMGVALAARASGGRLAPAFRPAVAFLVLAHLEALAITLLLDAYRQPVATVWKVRDGRHGATPGAHRR